MLKQRLFSVLRSYIPLAVAVTLLAGLTYAILQQALRQGANDPQIQMAKDAAAALATGQTLPNTPTVDIAASLAPYLIVFDAQGRPVSGSARLHGTLPSVPIGALQAARARGENRVTWQPEPGVRSATVIAPVRGAQSGYVLAGRSLREVERRTSDLLLLVAVGWLGALGATLVAAVAAHWLFAAPAIHAGSSSFRSAGQMKT